MKDNNSAKFYLLPAGLFFCLGLQVFHHFMGSVLRDVGLIFELPFFSILVGTSVGAFLLTLGFGLMLAGWIRRRSIGGAGGGKLVLAVGLIYVCVQVLTLVYVAYPYFNFLFDIGELLPLIGEYQVYLKGQIVDQPYLMIGRECIPLGLIYLLISWWCIR